MAAMNSSVLACTYSISAAVSSDLNAKLISVPSTGVSASKLPLIKAQQLRISESKESRGSDGRRNALALLAATLFTTAAAASNANAGVIEDYLEKSKANKVSSIPHLYAILFLRLSYNFNSNIKFLFLFCPTVLICSIKYIK